MDFEKIKIGTVVKITDEPECAEGDIIYGLLGQEFVVAKIDDDTYPGLRTYNLEGLGNAAFIDADFSEIKN